MVGGKKDIDWLRSHIVNMDMNCYKYEETEFGGSKRTLCDIDNRYLEGASRGRLKTEDNADLFEFYIRTDLGNILYEFEKRGKFYRRTNFGGEASGSDAEMDFLTIKRDLETIHDIEEVINLYNEVQMRYLEQLMRR